MDPSVEGKEERIHNAICGISLSDGTTSTPERSLTGTQSSEPSEVMCVKAEARPRQSVLSTTER